MCSRLSQPFSRQTPDKPGSSSCRLISLGHHLVLTLMFVVIKLQERPKFPLLTHIPPPPSTSSFGLSTEEELYSMYPFVPYAQLPWTMKDSSVFRIRKLADWLTQNSTISIASTHGLNSGSVVNTSQWVVIPSTQPFAHVLL